MLLGCACITDAVALASELSFGGSSNVLCADAAGEAASLELSPMGLRVLKPEKGTLCHTNHFLAEGAGGWQAQLASNLTSVPRLERARSHAASRDKHGVEDLKRMLRDESGGLPSICRHPDPALPEAERIESVASVIMELARGVMHVAPDIPSRTEYQAVALAAEPVVR
jgi:isopenicillin-N N-acyltransferase-like protein